MSKLIYFSSVSGNTRRFVEKLGRDAARIPLRRGEPELVADEPYVLVVPTYGGGADRGDVPKQVIVGGNANFGEAYGLAGDIIAAKCGVPVLYRFELFGTPDDVARVNAGLDQFWHTHSSPTVPK